MAHFVILGTQRTGTTLLKTMLNDHPDVFCAGELFIHRNPVSRFRRAYLGKRVGRTSPLSYSNWVREKFSYAAMDLIGWRRDALTTQFLEELYNKELASSIGFKLMFNQSLRHPRAVYWCLERNLRIIHVVRSNLLKTLVSRRMTRLQPRSHTRKPDTNKGLQIKLNCRSLVKELEAIEQSTYGWTDVAGEKPQYLQLPYEDFVRNRELWLEKICSHLDIPARKLESKLKKLNPEQLSDSVGNYEEVRDTLAGSKFEKFLD